MGIAESRAIKIKAISIFFFMLCLISTDSMLRFLRNETIIKYIAAMIGVAISVVIKKFSSTSPASIRPGYRPITSTEVKITIAVRNIISWNESLFNFLFSTGSAGFLNPGQLTAVHIRKSFSISRII